MRKQHFKAIEVKATKEFLEIIAPRALLLKFQILDNSLGPSNFLALLWHCPKTRNVKVQWMCGHVCMCVCAVMDRQTQPFRSMGLVDRATTLTG